MQQRRYKSLRRLQCSFAAAAAAAVAAAASAATAAAAAAATAIRHLRIMSDPIDLEPVRLLSTVYSHPLFDT